MNKVSLCIIYSMCSMFIFTSLFGNPVIASSELDRASSSAGRDDENRTLTIVQNVDQVLAGMTIVALMQRLSAQDKEAVLKILNKYDDTKAPRIEVEVVSCCPASDLDDKICALQNALDACCAGINAQFVLVNAQLEAIIAILVGP